MFATILETFMIAMVIMQELLIMWLNIGFLAGFQHFIA
tara:strand:- start:88 stop:201 length:114 start_codon:yes stop_codon:yes gene_type:complete